ncbi:MAG TPA: thioredoxin-like domain-containing protein [Steroidobacteraceae bacterium]|nr:thioredoxin-like domain-containing protein [Steroidobacteraceae bacterium]
MRQATSFAPITLPDKGSPVSFGRATAWLNSRPLGPDDLRGKIVLVDFWTYTCVNWRRTLPWVRAWYEKYRDSGLVVIGVHTPEFRFESDVENIRRAAREQGVDYPIAVDSNHAIWDAFSNQFWPAIYLLDGQGRVRDRKFGEGGYEQVEASIQRLLTEAGQRSFDRAPVAVSGAGAEAGADWHNLQSSETYLGSAHASSFASVRTVLPDRSRLYSYPSHFRLNEWALEGSWRVESDSVQSIASRDKVAFRFHARDLHLVMGPTANGLPIPFRVTLDGKPPGDAHGLDLDEKGRGTIDAQRMYQLIRQTERVADRQFEIEFLGSGAELFVFTFG